MMVLQRRRQLEDSLAKQQLRTKAYMPGADQSAPGIS
jgi:hypothetical protein